MSLRLYDDGHLSHGRRYLSLSVMAANVVFAFCRSNMSSVIICFAGLAFLNSVAVAAPTVTLINPTARLDYGHTDGRATMVLQVDGLDVKQLQDPGLLKKEDLHDFGATQLQQLDINIDEGVPPGASGRTWIIRMEIAGLPANTAQKRYLRVDLAGKSTTLEYTLTNKAAESFSWTVKAPVSIAINPEQAIPIMIAVGPVAATGVVLAGPYLTEKTTKVLIAPHGLRLCRFSSGSCNGNDDDRIILFANSMTQLWLRDATGIGQYEGTVTIASAEKPEGDTVTLAVFSTTPLLQWLGIATIFFSAVLTWFVTVFARNLVNRAQMMLPVTRLRGRLGTVQARLEGHPPGVNTPAINGAIIRLRNDLAEPQLVALGLPGAIPSPWSPTPASNQVDAYRNFLQGVADWLAVLEIVSGDGFTVIWPKWNVATPQQRQAITEATTALDSLAIPQTAPAPDAVRQQVASRVNVVNGAFNIAAGGGTGPTPRPYEQLTLQIVQISLVAWVIVFLATTVVGSLALVLNNSFGSLRDFMTCVAWGLGLPIGGQALTASFGSVGTSLGISMLK